MLIVYRVSVDYYVQSFYETICIYIYMLNAMSDRDYREIFLRRRKLLSHFREDVK